MPTDVQGVSAVPWLVARFSALPVEPIQALSAPRLVDAADNLATLLQGIATGRESLSESLHAAIGTVADHRTRHRLLALRRDLYNGRSVTAERLADAQALPSALERTVSEYAGLLAQRDRAEQALHVRHAEALIRNRQAVRSMLHNQAFVNGLLLSSPTLAGNVERYARSAPAHVSSREEQIERGLLRYLTRSAMKATPFATLCTIIPGRISEETSPRTAITLKGNLQTQTSVVRLNRRLHRALWQRMKQCEAVRRTLLVEHDPLAVDRSEPLALWVLERISRESLPLGALQAAIRAGGFTDGPPSDGLREVDALFSSGFLRFRNPVPAQCTDWHQPFCELLAGVDDDDARTARAIVLQLHALAARFATAPLQERESLLADMRTALASALASLGIQEPRLAQDIIFEDATAQATLVIARGPGVDDALQRTAEWITAVGRIAEWRAAQATMRHIFDLHHEGEVAPVPLLHFYRTYLREHLQPAHEREERAARGEAVAASLLDNPFGLDVVARMIAARDRVMKRLWLDWHRTPLAVELDLTSDALDTALSDLHPPQASPGSTCLFGQLTGTDGDAAAVRIVSAKDHYPAGFGKYHSRFLHLMPVDMQRQICAHNARLAGDGAILAEVSADAFFNANLHPPIVESAIECSTADGYAPAGRLAPQDLDVTRDPDDPHALRLVHRGTGRRVIPVDLGFVSLRRRSLIYQTLVAFCPAGDAYAPLPEQLGPIDEAAPPCIRYRPRFTYANRLVLSRRRWLVPDTLFPHCASGETSASYFARVRRWRAGYGIDDQVFALVHPASDHDTDARSAASRDWRKPQYIDFTSPLLVKLFAKLPGPLVHFELELQECYPNAEELPEAGGQHHASELVLQFDTSG